MGAKSIPNIKLTESAAVCVKLKTGHSLLVVRKVDTIIFFFKHKKATFSEKKRLKEDFFEEKVFIRPRSHKSDPFGNTGKLKKYQTKYKNKDNVEKTEHMYLSITNYLHTLIPK